MFFSRPRHNYLYESSRVELASGSNPSWAEVREHIQEKKPFAILNFLNRDKYNAFLKDLEKVEKYDYFRQTLHTSHSKEVLDKKEVPSVFFMPKGDIEEFFDVMEKCMAHYDLDSVLFGFKEEGKVVAKYRDGEENTVGNEIVVSLEPSEMEPDDYYQFESNYYKFVPV